MRKLLPLATVVLLAGCPSELINGTTTLNPKVLAVTKTMAAGGKEYSVSLKWSSVVNAKTFQITKKYESESVSLRPEKSDACEYIDRDVEPGKHYSYTIRALDRGNNQLTVSDEVSVEVLAPSLDRPGVSTSLIEVSTGRPQVSWTVPQGASWYFINVYDTDGKDVYGAYANSMPWQIGTPSYQAGLSLPGFKELTGTSLENAKIYYWKVSAIRANKEKLEEATSIEIRVSGEGKLSYF